MGNKVSRNYHGNCDICFCIKCRGCLVLLHCKGGVDFSNSQEEQEVRLKWEQHKDHEELGQPPSYPIANCADPLQPDSIWECATHLCAPCPPVVYVQTQPGTRPWSPPLKYILIWGLFRRNVEHAPPFSYPFSDTMFYYKRKIPKCKSKQDMLKSWGKLGNVVFCCCFEVVLSHTFAFGISWTKRVTFAKVFLDTVMICSIISNLNDICKKHHNLLTDVAATVHICQSLIFIIILPMNTL